jgi:hypothetical protein
LVGTVYSYEPKTTKTMKKLALVLALGIFANFSYSQSWSNQWLEEDSISSYEPIVPIMKISDKQEFDSIRLSVHMGIFKYKVYHYGADQEIQSIESFDEFPRILNEEYLPISRYFLIGDNGQLLQMLDVLPKDSEL